MIAARLQVSPEAVPQARDFTERPKSVQWWDGTAKSCVVSTIPMKFENHGWGALRRRGLAFVQSLQSQESVSSETEFWNCVVFVGESRCSPLLPTTQNRDLFFLFSFFKKFY